jgi:hypothetical protein
MRLSKRSIDILLDLVADRLTSITVFDLDDAREVMVLAGCQRELRALKSGTGSTVVPFPRLVYTAGVSRAAP